MVKTADSMHTVRTPNILFIKNKVIKGVHAKFFMAELLGRNCIGPFRKNFVVPNEAANKLKKNVKRGRNELKVGKDKLELPYSSKLKNPSLVNSIANEMLT